MIKVYCRDLERELGRTGGKEMVNADSWEEIEGDCVACSLALVTAAYLKKDIAAVFGRAYSKRLKFIEDGRRALNFVTKAPGLSTTMLLA